MRVIKINNPKVLAENTDEDIYHASPKHIAMPFCLGAKGKDKCPMPKQKNRNQRM